VAAALAGTLAFPSGSLVYLSGYQLASASGELLVCWLERQPQVTPLSTLARALPIFPTR
jgi:hypothetical protein